MAYAHNMKTRLPATMTLPPEFEALFAWIEANGFFIPSERFPGDRLGMLGPLEDPMRGTIILFRIETPEQARESGEGWFGKNVPNVGNRLVPFARTGGDGSHVAFWIDDHGRQQIVHLGSEGEVGILTATPLDFLRLLAIGYEEISGDCIAAPDAPPDDQDGDRIIANELYRSWLARTYAVAIPQTASEIMRKPPNGARPVSDDPFFNWVRQHQGW